MTLGSPDNVELDMLEYILRLGNSVSERKIRIKCNHKGIDYEKFLKDWDKLISVKISRSEKIVTINDIDKIMDILRNNGRDLISHHSQRSRRY
jgi:hypothetical protein